MGFRLRCDDDDDEQERAEQSGAVEVAGDWLAWQYGSASCSGLEIVRLGRDWLGEHGSLLRSSQAVGLKVTVFSSLCLDAAGLHRSDEAELLLR